MLLSLYYRMTAKGLTRQQREEVKQVVFDHYIQKISISNTIDKIEQLMYVKLGELDSKIKRPTQTISQARNI